MAIAVDIHQLKKVYANGFTALKGIDLEVKQGDFFALLGQNGAGKSTTIGILCSLIKKTSGEASIFGHDIETDLENAKSCIGVVPQEMNFNPFEKTSQILINQAGYYGIPRYIAIDRAKKYLKAMGLWDYHDTITLRLSGGMKRRLMIARALMNEPPLLILDEPTAGVDIELRYYLWEFLKTLNQQGTTIILTTHYLEEAEQLCKHVAIIDKGEIITHSDMKSLINRLNVETIILELNNPLPASLTLEHYPYRILDPLTLEVDIRKGFSINELFNQLNQAHIIVNSIRNKRNRLEELFVNLVRNNH